MVAAHRLAATKPSFAGSQAGICSEETDYSQALLPVRDAYGACERPPR
jgi:hypothetical protein